VVLFCNARFCRFRGLNISGDNFSPHTWFLISFNIFLATPVSLCLSVSVLARGRFALGVLFAPTLLWLLLFLYCPHPPAAFHTGHVQFEGGGGGGRWPHPARELCSRCGLCDTPLIAHVQEACAFLGDGMARAEVCLRVGGGA